eukprot:gene12232-13493_t
MDFLPAAVRSAFADYNIFDILFKSQWLGALATFLVCYTAYYLLVVVKKPRLVCCEKGELFAKLQKNLKVLNEYYWPTFWCFSAHLMTICRVAFKPNPSLPYKRQLLETPDGGLISLDWLDDDENKIYPDPATRPTLIILPGLTGTSETSYCKQLALHAKELGMRAIILNNRGLGKNIFLKTPRTFCGNNTDDFKFVLKQLAKQLPNSPVIGVGVSLGGCIMTHYLAELADGPTQMVGAFIISVPWNCFSSSVSLEKPINWLLFNRHLTQKLLGLVDQNLHVFEQHLGNLPYELDHVMKSKSIREFDERFTSRTFGYNGHIEYYNAASLDAAPLENINVPTLFLNSTDDPFAPGNSIPTEIIKKNPLLAVIITHYGGHIGFTEGFFIKSRSIVENTFMQFAKAVGIVEEKKSN